VLDKTLPFQGGSKGTEVGGTRVLMVGKAQLFEQLTAQDDCKHVLRWICLSHPQTISPFGVASFVNYHSSLHMREVTVGDHTYVEWKGEPPFGVGKSFIPTPC